MVGVGGGGVYALQGFRRIEHASEDAGDCLAVLQGRIGDEVLDGGHA